MLTEGGKSLGVVHDPAILVGSTGEVVGYQIEKPTGGHGYIPLPAQLAVSGAATTRVGRGARSRPNVDAVTTHCPTQKGQVTSSPTAFRAPSPAPPPRARPGPTIPRSG